MLFLPGLIHPWSFFTAEAAEDAENYKYSALSAFSAVKFW
jgi:hypothetical protein